jgi:hypothetical protein
LVQIYGTYPPGFYPESVALNLSLKCLVPLGPDFLFKNGTLGTLPFLYLFFKILAYIIIAVK